MIPTVTLTDGSEDEEQWEMTLPLSGTRHSGHLVHWNHLSVLVNTTEFFFIPKSVIIDIFFSGSAFLLPHTYEAPQTEKAQKPLRLLCFYLSMSAGDRDSVTGRSRTSDRDRAQKISKYGIG